MPKDIPRLARLTSDVPRAWYWAVLALCLLIGVALRFVGLTRGDGDFALPGNTQYYQFHPDEESLVRAAIAPIDPLDPPYTNYGLLPVYVLRTVVRALSLDDADLGATVQKRAAFVTARAVAASVSCAALVATWVLGVRVMGWVPALLGLIFTVFAPGAIQQGHFFIVDGFLTAIAPCAVLSIVRAMQSGKYRAYIAAGVLIGALGSVRLNGLALGIVLLVGHLARAETRSWRGLGAPVLLGSGVAALATVLALQPYLLVQPELVMRQDTIFGFGLALRVAQLEYLQPWTLVDVGGTPFWDHWFGLWPQICGWPLTLAFLMGAGYVGLWGSQAQRLVVLWCGLYFASIGLLPVKAVRYVLPLLPLLALCTGFMCEAVWRRWRIAGVILAVGLAGHVAVYESTLRRIVVSRLVAGSQSTYPPESP